MRALGAFGLLLAVGLALRLPFFFPAVIGTDESTFVLIGQALLDGDLPYVELWALKPPLAFAFYSIVIAVFGKTVVAVRLAGTLCVVSSAFLLYLTARRLWSGRVGVTAALLCVTAVSLLPSGQATLTEHVALVPLMGALYLLVRDEPSAGTWFVAGMLLAVATLVRLNLAGVVILVGLYLLVRPVQHGVAYAAGGTLVVALTWLPYYVTGHHGLWWTSVVAAPLQYAHSESHTVRNLKLYAMQALGLYKDESALHLRGPLHVTFACFGAAGGAAVLVKRWRDGALERRGVGLFVLFMAGVGVGILKSGAPYGHHLLQLVPFAAVLAAVFAGQLSGLPRQALVVFTGALLVSSMGPIANEYRTAVSRALAGEPLRYGPAHEIADYLKRENTEGRPVYLLVDHIAYWFSDSRPPTRLTTHPAHIAMGPLIETVAGKGASTQGELRNVFRQDPEFVVMGTGDSYLKGGGRQWLEKVLDEEYFVATRIRGRTIYRRRGTE